jgi:biopolymer transport protein ExbB/TolQ
MKSAKTQRQIEQNISGEIMKLSNSKATVISVSLLALATMPILFQADFTAFAETANAAETLAGQTDNNTSNWLVYWEQCAEFRWALGGTLILGLMAAFYKYLTNLRQTAIERQLITTLDADTTVFKELAERASAVRDNLYAAMIISVSKAVHHNQFDRVDDLVETYRNYENDRMANFARWMMYLSGACGALGLLGTVHGMKSTFGTEGGFDKTQALMGMSIALATTGVGLIFSLVLDFFAGIVNSTRERRVQKNIEKAEELKLIVHDMKNTQG